MWDFSGRTRVRTPDGVCVNLVCRYFFGHAMGPSSKRGDDVDFGKINRSIVVAREIHVGGNGRETGDRHLVGEENLCEGDWSPAFVGVMPSRKTCIRCVDPIGGGETRGKI